MIRRVLTLFCALGLVGCGAVGQERVSVELFVGGVDARDPFETDGGAKVTLDRADLAFGPLYLCAGVTAGDLCSTARFEWLGTVVVDMLDGAGVYAGELTGVTGAVQSWMYDLGISSQLTRSEPYVLDAARELGGVSFVVHGTAEMNGVEIVFSAAVPLHQANSTEWGLPVIRKSASEQFYHDVVADGPPLFVKFDPRDLISGVDFSAFEAGEVSFSEGTEAYRAVRNALASGGRASMTFGTSW